jgi:hypothetical protein
VRLRKQILTTKLISIDVALKSIQKITGKIYLRISMDLLQNRTMKTKHQCLVEINELHSTINKLENELEHFKCQLSKKQDIMNRYFGNHVNSSHGSFETVGSKDDQHTHYDYNE